MHLIIQILVIILGVKIRCRGELINWVDEANMGHLTMQVVLMLLVLK